MKRLLILLLIVGCVFGDTIEYKRKILGFWTDDIRYRATIIKIEDGKLWYTQQKLFGKQMDTIPCKNIYSIIDSNGNTIDFNCVLNTLSTHTSPALTKHDVNEFTRKPVLGGTLIAFGSTLVLTTIGKECDDCELKGTSASDILNFNTNTQKFNDDIINIQKIGFGLIAIGGILVALGI